MTGAEVLRTGYYVLRWEVGLSVYHDTVGKQHIVDMVKLVASFGVQVVNIIVVIFAHCSGILEQ